MTHTYIHIYVCACAIHDIAWPTFTRDEDLIKGEYIPLYPTKACESRAIKLIRKQFYMEPKLL